MFKRLMVLLALLTVGTQVFAQHSVTGKVTDAQGEPLIGVNVLIKGTNTGAMTDLDGVYRLSAKPDAILVFSSIGYTTQDIPVNGRSTINVTLSDDTMFLDDVVVIGYGSAKRKDLTGSLTQIDNRLISAQNASSATKALEGAIPGLVFASVDGQPGNDAGLRVRGLGSTNAGSSNALVVIDNVPAQGENPLSQLNQEDIASITVLKDAASTAIYGSRGANGVILVTTKSGQAGKTKVSFQARVGWNTRGTFQNGQIQTAQELYEYVWQSIYNSVRYGVGGPGAAMGQDGEYFTNINGKENMSHEAAALFASQHLFDYNGTATFGRNILGNYMAYDVPGATYIKTGSLDTSSATMEGAYLVNTDGKLNPNARLLYNDTYKDAIIQNAFRQQYDISASGGSEKENHYLSLGFNSDPSYIRNSNFQRITGRANINVQLFKWLKVGANVGYTRSTTSYMAGYWAARNAGSNQGSIPRFVLGANAMFPFFAHDKDGNFIYDKNGEKVRNVLANSTYSPLGPTGANYGSTDIWYVLDNDVRGMKTNTLNTRTYAEIPFLNHFTFRVDLAYDLIQNMETRYYNGTTGRAAGMGGYFGKRSTTTEVYNIQDKLMYTQDFGKHHVDAMALFENSDWEAEAVSWGSYKEFLPGFTAAGNFVGRYGSAGGAATPSYGHDIERMRSWLGRANYIYADKYYLSGSIRRDGSSKFRDDKRWGTFWSVGAGWRFTQEEFLKDSNWLTNGKLRASYGVIGNQNGISRYASYRTWSYSATYAPVTNGTGQPVDTKLSMGGFVNDGLTWENTNTFDVGLDLTFWDRVDVTLDYYNRVTTNSVFNKPVSYHATGQTTLQQNCAEITNRGVELDINADIIRTKDWRWNIAFNATHYNTVLTGLPEDAIPAQVEGLPEGTWESYDGGAWTAAGGAQQSQNFYLRGIGRDWYNIYMYSFAGIDQKSGLPMYWHNVTKKESESLGGPYAGMEVGSKVATTNYANATKQEIGDALPELVGGFNTQLTYKNWSLSAQFAYQLGGHFFLRDYAQYLFNPTKNSTVYYSSMNISRLVKDNTWLPDRTDARFPMQWYPVSNVSTQFSGTSTANQGWMFTDQALFTASYLRLKNVTMSYYAPKSFFQRVGLNFVSGMRIFASAENLFLLSAAPGVDPAMSISGGYTDVDEYIFPQMRTFTFGINLDF